MCCSWDFSTRSLCHISSVCVFASLFPLGLRWLYYAGSSSKCRVAELPWYFEFPKRVSCYTAGFSINSMSRDLFAGVAVNGLSYPFGALTYQPIQKTWAADILVNCYFCIFKLYSFLTITHIGQDELWTLCPVRVHLRHLLSPSLHLGRKMYRSLWALAEL